MDPSCTVVALMRLAEECRAEGLSAEVEADALRVRLPGRCYARSDADGQILGWAVSKDVLWYGRFDTVADLVRSARTIRRLSRLARVGLGLIGAWFLHVTATSCVPGYRLLWEHAPLLNVLLGLGLVLGLGAWLAARVVRWWCRRRSKGVVWLRGPLQGTGPRSL